MAYGIIVSALGPNTSFFLFGGNFYMTCGSLGTGAWTWTRDWPLIYHKIRRKLPFSQKHHQMGFTIIQEDDCPKEEYQDEPI